MPMMIPPNSKLGEEMKKWEKPYRYEQFPQMLYRATKRADGVIVLDERQCMRIVKSEGERQEAFEAGWRANPKEAMDLAWSREKSISDAAAHRAYEDRNMSEGAKAEAKAVEDSTIEHVAEVPAKPKRKYTRRAQPTA